MKSIIALLLFAVMLTTGKAETIAEPTGRFSYNLTGDWALKHVPGVKFGVPMGRKADGNPGNIMFDLLPKSPTLAESEITILKGVKEKLTSMGCSNFQILNQSGYETAAGMIGAQAVVSVTRPDGQVSRMIYFFFQRNDGYGVIAICSVAGEGTSYDDDFEAIMTSFKFLQ